MLAAVAATTITTTPAKQLLGNRARPPTAMAEGSCFGTNGSMKQNPHRVKSLWLTATYIALARGVIFRSKSQANPLKESVDKQATRIK